MVQIETLVGIAIAQESYPIWVRTITPGGIVNDYAAILVAITTLTQRLRVPQQHLLLSGRDAILGTITA